MYRTMVGLAMLGGDGDERCRRRRARSRRLAASSRGQHDSLRRARASRCSSSSIRQARFAANPACTENTPPIGGCWTTVRCAFESADPMASGCVAVELKGRQDHVHSTRRRGRRPVRIARRAIRGVCDVAWSRATIHLAKRRRSTISSRSGEIDADAGMVSSSRRGYSSIFPRPMNFRSPSGADGRNASWPAPRSSRMDGDFALQSDSPPSGERTATPICPALRAPALHAPRESAARCSKPPPRLPRPLGARALWLTTYSHLAVESAAFTSSMASS